MNSILLMECVNYLYESRCYQFILFNLSFQFFWPSIETDVQFVVSEFEQKVGPKEKDWDSFPHQHDIEIEADFEASYHMVIYTNYYNDLSPLNLFSAQLSLSFLFIESLKFSKIKKLRQLIVYPYLKCIVRGTHLNYPSNQFSVLFYLISLINWIWNWIHITQHRIFHSCLYV